MAVHQLDKTQWGPFFDRVSDLLENTEAEIEAASLLLGDQTQAERLRFYGIVYDPKNDMVEIVVDDLDHLIAKPREVYVEDGAGGGLLSVEIVDESGTRHILKLREPLMLPAAA